MITHLLNSFFIGLLFIDMMERRFPVQFENFMFTLSYSTIYYFSKLQIFFVNMNTNINNIIENNPNLLKIKQKFGSILSSKQESQQVTRYFVKKNKLYHLSDTRDSQPDFMILSWLSNDKKCANKKIIYNREDDILMIDSSDIKFLLIEFTVGNNRAFKIDLKTEEYNYYIIGNKFTKDFFIFYINHYLQFNIDIKDTDKCSIKLIDHDVNKLELDFTDKNESILLEKNGYKLSITNHSEEK
jgi:hypothetical protein